MTAPDIEAGRRFVAQHPPPGELVFCAVSGAHLYGFPSPDSDLDLKGAHAVPTRQLLGLRPDTSTHDLTEWSEGLEMDLTTVELSRLLALLLRGNGNTVEQLLSPFQLVESSTLSDLRELARGALSKAFFNHYAGFFRSKRKEFLAQAEASVKTVLYAYRVVLTGLHLMRSGRVEPNLDVLAREYAVEGVAELMHLKMSTAEHVTLPTADAARHEAAWDDLEARLCEARDASPLPDSAPNADEVDAWLVSYRLSRL